MIKRVNTQNQAISLFVCSRAECFTNVVNIEKFATGHSFIVPGKSQEMSGNKKTLPNPTLS